MSATEKTKYDHNMSATEKRTFDDSLSERTSESRQARFSQIFNKFRNSNNTVTPSGRPTRRPGDAAAYMTFDSVGAVTTRSPGAATAYMTVEEEEKKAEAMGLS